MDFEKMLSHQIENIDVPDELSPENMAKMLKALPPKMQSERRSITLSTNVNRNIVMRSISAAAALAALAAGFVAYTDKSAEPAQLDSEIVYKDVSTPHSYDDLFDIYTQIYLTGNQPQDDDLESVGAGSDSAFVTESEKDISENLSADGFSGADIVRAENGTIYYLSDSKIYSLTADGVKLCADVSGKEPVEMYVDSDRLVLVSEQVRKGGSTSDSAAGADILNASDVPASDAYAADSTLNQVPSYQESGGSVVIRTDSAADIYDISGSEAEFLGSFNQSGRYVSSRMSEGRLYMVTCYSDYRVKPLGEETDLDNYVPYYMTGNIKQYVAAEDIIIPANAASTDYTVVSSVDTLDPENVSVQAVLGGSRKIFCTGSALYTAGVGKDGTEYTAVTAFDISDGGIRYITSGSVEGTILRYGGFDEYGGNLRVVTRSARDGEICTNIYVLDRTLSVINSAGRLLPGIDAKVSFANRYAVLYEAGSDSPSLIVDLISDPPVVADDMMNSGSLVFCEFTDDLIAGFGRQQDPLGNEELVLTMFSAYDGSKLADVSFAAEEGVSCEALSNRKALLADGEKRLIGVPAAVTDEFGIHARYYLFSYENGGFVRKGQIEYSDTDESCIFHSAVISGDVLYVISDSRIVLAQLSDMKVIESIDIK